MLWTMLAVIFFLCVALAAKSRTIAFLKAECERYESVNNRMYEGVAGVRGRNAALKAAIEQAEEDRDKALAELDMSIVNQKSLGEDLAGFDKRITELTIERDDLTEQIKALQMKLRSIHFIAESCLPRVVTMGAGVIHQRLIPVPESTEPPHFTA